MRRVLVLGSTGSVGRTALQVLEELRETHRVVGLAARSRGSELAAQARRFPVEALALADPGAARSLGGCSVPVLQGADAAARLIQEVDADLVLAGITGAAGLPATLEALRAGRDVALANKEALVMAGPLVRRLASRSGSLILPVDSEHSAVFQCLHGQPAGSTRRVILTASGGPFRATPAGELAQVTPEQALRHPTWEMGPKITIDSATLFNKALEVVEARWLFDLSPDQIDVVVHPQSIVHSMVEFRDGSLLAQLGLPDMAVPIRYALSYPDRSETRCSYFDLDRFRTLTFEEPDRVRFPALDLGYEAARLGGTAGAVLNAADEVAVEQFLGGEIAFDRIAPTVEKALERMDLVEDPTLEQILAADQWARQEAMTCCC